MCLATIRRVKRSENRVMAHLEMVTAMIGGVGVSQAYVSRRTFSPASQTFC